MEDKQYIAIDLKSFYASVECVDRGLDPLTAFLVVADASRTEKTICLAVTPALKELGIRGRPRLFEVVQGVKQINRQRSQCILGGKLSGNAMNKEELAANPGAALSYIVAKPRMAKYLEVSTKVFAVYLKYVAPEDVHVYSIDEVFIDVTPYLATYKMTAAQLAMQMIRDVLAATGITATAGVGTNLYLAKIAMDIVAKKMEPDANGVRLAQLDEAAYRRQLWNYKPITDFWQIGSGIARRLAQQGMFTMGDVARCSAGGSQGYYNEELLFKMFGVNAELLIDHAWGYESCTMADIKAYVPESNSLSSGQVLQEPYTFEQGRLVIKEMADQLALELTAKGCVAEYLTLTVGYDIVNLQAQKSFGYRGPVVRDGYGRIIPKAAHGSIKFKIPLCDGEIIANSAAVLYNKIVNPNLWVRRLNLEAGQVTSGVEATAVGEEQLDLFGEREISDRNRKKMERGRQRQLAVVQLQKKFGKNAVLKGRDLLGSATTKQRNSQIGGHNA